MTIFQGDQNATKKKITPTAVVWNFSSWRQKNVTEKTLTIFKRLFTSSWMLYKRRTTGWNTEKTVRKIGQGRMKLEISFQSHVAFYFLENISGYFLVYFFCYVCIFFPYLRYSKSCRKFPMTLCKSCVFLQWNLESRNVNIPFGKADLVEWRNVNLQRKKTTRSGHDVSRKNCKHILQRAELVLLKYSTSMMPFNFVDPSLIDFFDKTLMDRWERPWRCEREVRHKK